MCNLLPFTFAEVLQRAHIVQPIGEFDEHDTDVVRHRQHHLAEILGLFFLIIAEGDLADLRHPVDQVHDVLPEPLLQFMGGRQGIFEGIVQ